MIKIFEFLKNNIYIQSNRKILSKKRDELPTYPEHFLSGSMVLAFPKESLTSEGSLMGQAHSRVGLDYILRS
jgi:hypothetical protein